MKLKLSVLEMLCLGGTKDGYECNCNGYVIRIFNTRAKAQKYKAEHGGHVERSSISNGIIDVKVWIWKADANYKNSS